MTIDLLQRQYSMRPSLCQTDGSALPMVRRKDVQKHGEYRTKRVILESYDETTAAMAGGPPYQTRLDPPPGDPRVAHAREAGDT
jgi:hypothetical protein